MSAEHIHDCRTCTTHYTACSDDDCDKPPDAPCWGCVTSALARIATALGLPADAPVEEVELRAGALRRTERSAFLLTEAITYQGTESAEARRRLEDLCDAIDNEPERTAAPPRAGIGESEG